MMMMMGMMLMGPGTMMMMGMMTWTVWHKLVIGHTYSTIIILLRVETGRWIGLKREDRFCGQCGLREVENVEHFVLRCDGLVREGFEERGDKEVTLAFDKGCRNLKTWKAIEGMWRKR